MSGAPHGDGAFAVKALYTVPELARLIGMHDRTLRRWLARKDVPLMHVGASVAVPLVAFREAFPEVWASIRAMTELGHRGPCPVCGAGSASEADPFPRRAPAGQTRRSAALPDRLAKTMCV